LDVRGKMKKDYALAELRTIPGVGTSISQDLYALGIRTVFDLKGRDPEDLYLRSCNIAGRPVDRCLLYVYRCAVYYASHQSHDPSLLQWWNWSDRNIAARKTAKRKR
jgi:hypothetical protein